MVVRGGVVNNHPPVLIIVRSIFAAEVQFGGGPFVPALKTCLLVYRSEERKITIGFSRIDWPPAALTIRLPPP